VFRTRLYIVAPLHNDTNADRGICNSAFPPSNALRTDHATLRWLF